MDGLARDTSPRSATLAPPITAWWLGRTLYRDAWRLQHRLVSARAANFIGDQLLLLEHEPVLTLGRHSDPSHVIATPAELASRGIELIETERGGEVTYHGPGQLTAYPIVKLADRSLLIRPLVRALEAALTQTCGALGVAAGPSAGYPGCWCGDGTRKIGAIGVRIEHGVSYHGIALNVTVRLSDFDLIDACGMPGLESTSIASERGQAARADDRIGRASGGHLCACPGRRGRRPAGGRSPASSRPPGGAGRAGVAARPIRAARRRRRWLMAAGLFELRRDNITGWWVATVVDRQFDRQRFALPAAAVDDGGACQNCSQPPGDGVRIRTLKDYAFHVVGAEFEARELERSLAQVAMAQARASGTGGRSSRRRASIGRSRRLAASC